MLNKQNIYRRKFTCFLEACNGLL